MRLETNTTYIPVMRLLFPMHGTLMSVSPGEPVYGVQESYARNREGTGDRRYQVLLMPRGDTLSGFWTDLGPASDFEMVVGGLTRQAPPYYQPVLMAHDVAECRHMAEESRMDDFALKLLQQNIEESTIFEQYARIMEEDMYFVKNRSTFGPGGVNIRNGYSPYGAQLQQERLAVSGH